MTPAELKALAEQAVAYSEDRSCCSLEVPETTVLARAVLALLAFRNFTETDENEGDKEDSRVWLDSALAALGGEGR